MNGLFAESSPPVQRIDRSSNPCVALEGLVFVEHGGDTKHETAGPICETALSRGLDSDLRPLGYTRSFSLLRSGGSGLARTPRFAQTCDVLDTSAFFAKLIASQRSGSGRREVAS